MESSQGRLILNVMIEYLLTKVVMGKPDVSIHFSGLAALISVDTAQSL